MRIPLFNKFFLIKNKLDFRYLYLVYFVGLVAGAYISFLVSDSFTDNVFTLLLRVPSFGYLLLANLIPIICISLLLHFSFYFLCYPAMFLHSVLCGFTGTTISILAGSSGWLFRILILFSSISISVLIWYLLHCKMEESKVIVFLLIFVAFAITLVDYCFVSRFLQSLTVCC